MSSPNTIQEFLVGLVYQVDKTSEQKFLTGIRDAGVKVAEFGAGVAAATAGIVASLAKVAEGMEQVYFSAQRTGASVENIKALGFAFSQVGGTAAQARGAVESLASFMRSSPGASTWLQSLGVQTTDLQGHARDTSDVLGDLGQRLSSMPFYRAKAYASVAGIDEPTLLLLRRGMGEFGAEYHRMYAAAGIDAQKAGADAHGFMVQLRDLGAAFSILGDKVASELTKRAGGDIGRFREILVANFGRISAVVTGAAHVILSVADGMMDLGAKAFRSLGDLAGWFNGLDHSTKMAAGTVAAFIALLVAPEASLAAALALVWEDYKIW